MCSAQASSRWGWPPRRGSSIDQTERPRFGSRFKSIPMELGDWVGRDEPVASRHRRARQTTEYLNRVYESRTHPGLRLTLWINYSEQGNNLRHTPEICLPSGGWTKIESQTRCWPSASEGKNRSPHHSPGLRPR